jgi:positive regulator of sigma E activity
MKRSFLILLMVILWILTPIVLRELKVVGSFLLGFLFGYLFVKVRKKLEVDSHDGVGS